MGDRIFYGGAAVMVCALAAPTQQYKSGSMLAFSSHLTEYKTVQQAILVHVKLLWPAASVHDNVANSICVNVNSIMAHQFKIYNALLLLWKQFHVNDIWLRHSLTDNYSCFDGGMSQEDMLKRGILVFPGKTINKQWHMSFCAWWLVVLWGSFKGNLVDLEPC